MKCEKCNLEMRKYELFTSSGWECTNLNCGKTDYQSFVSDACYSKEEEDWIYNKQETNSASEALDKLAAKRGLVRGNAETDEQLQNRIDMCEAFYMGGCV